MALNRSPGLVFGGRLPEAVAGRMKMKLLRVPGTPTWLPLGEGSQGLDASPKHHQVARPERPVGVGWGRQPFSSPETAHLHKDPFRVIGWQGA